MKRKVGKFEVVARRNPKTQENARVGGSRCVVSVVATVASWMYKGKHRTKLFLYMFCLSSALKEPILVRGWDCKLDVFGVQFCSCPFHASKLLLTNADLGVKVSSRKWGSAMQHHSCNLCCSMLTYLSHSCVFSSNVSSQTRTGIQNPSTRM